MYEMTFSLNFHHLIILLYYNNMIVLRLGHFDIEWLFNNKTLLSCMCKYRRRTYHQADIVPKSNGLGRSDERRWPYHNRWVLRIWTHVNCRRPAKVSPKTNYIIASYFSGLPHTVGVASFDFCRFSRILGEHLKNISHFWLLFVTPRYYIVQYFTEQSNVFIIRAKK